MKEVSWKLLEPVKVGRLSLKNRIVMPPMCTHFATPDGAVTERLLDYYSERARGGAGTIIVEFSYIDDQASQAVKDQVGIYSDHLLPGLSSLARTIKGEGATAIIQIMHAGRQSSSVYTGREPIAPSAIPVQLPEQMHRELSPPREITIDEIEDVQNSFAEAAGRARRAGFDGVELHGAHGYLISSFLSPAMNKRTDRYGGPIGNRARFALETIKKVRASVSDEYTIGFRINGDDFLPGGLTLTESSRLATMLEQAGIDYIHISAGIHASLFHMIQPNYLKRAYLLNLAEGIKSRVSIPIITAGSYDAVTAERAVREGKADLVSFGRALIADPELPVKLVEGRIEDIRPCIRNNEGCIGRGMQGLPISCEVNPAVGKEREFRVTPAARKKNIMVVGGGPAGMETARLASLRGHEVTLLEKDGKPGGHLIEASIPSFKDDLRQLLGWLQKQIEKSNVNIRLNTEATPELVKQAKPDLLVMAVGSDFIVPSVRGIHKPIVAAADEVLMGKRKVSHRTVVVGGGLVGCETALYTAEELGKQVIIVEMLGEILGEIEPLSCIVLLDRLQKAGVEIRTGHKLEEIRDGGIICRDTSGQKHQVTADTVILAMGLVARSRLVKEFENLAPEVYAVGDCVKARNVHRAFQEAWSLWQYI